MMAPARFVGPTHASSTERGLTYSKGAALIHQAVRTFMADRGNTVVATAPRNRANLRSPHFGGGIENGANDLVVAGAPAEVAGEPVANLGFGRVRIALQQGLGRNRERPGVQKPHCSAACSRNFCCSGWRSWPCAMPSTVSIL